MHTNSALLFDKYCLSLFNKDLKVLEIGPAGIPSAYFKQVGIPSIQWHTLDFSKSVYIQSLTSNLTYQTENEYNFPIPDESYDIVLSGQVIEHVKMIWKWMKELKRITKPGGLIITISPVSWTYHEAPIDCWRIYPEGMRALLEEAGLKEELCIFETLEPKQFNFENSIPYYPSISTDAYIQLKYLPFIKFWNKMIKIIPKSKKLLVTLPVAYDTLTIARK